MNIQDQRKKVEKIFTERGFTAREHSIKNIIGKYLAPCLPHVTAIGTSGGKTFTTAARLEFLYSNGFIDKNEKVIILAADKSILRSNFYDSFNSFFENKPASFTYSAINNKQDLEVALNTDVQVIITLPQTICTPTKLSKLSDFNFKWLIQDEAHKWYFKKTIQDIIHVLKPQHQSLLTGTPFKFNRANAGCKEPKFLVEYTAVREMYENGYLSDFTAQVLHSDVALKQLDYVSILGNLKNSKKISNNEMIMSFDMVIDQIIKKLKLPFKDLHNTHNVTKNMASVFGKLQKTIIFTHGIPEANCLFKYLKQKGIGVVVTHSQTGIDSNEVFTTFKENDSCKVLIAVNQGKEGFDFTELYNVIDMTYSQNFEVVMQIIGRVLRKSSKITNKHFFKVAPKNTAGYFVDWMNALFMLFDEEWYSRFDGKNGFDIQIPNTLISGRKKSDKNSDPKPGGRKKGSFKPNNLDSFNSLEFMTKNKWFKMNDSLSTVATTTLREVIAIHNAEKTLDEFKQEIIGQNQDIKITKTSKIYVDPNRYLESLKKEEKPVKKGLSLSELKKIIME